MGHVRFLLTILLAVPAFPAWAGSGADRLVPIGSEVRHQALAAYGPFRVIDGAHAALVDATDAASPAQFAAMLRDFPGLAVLELRDCPGTKDDHANLRLGRMIRASGLATHVPAGGSVRSGAVDLFLAGATRRIDDGAEFAVHAWLDEEGRQASDYPEDAPENRRYLAYYRDMGLAPELARAFYGMTNSVPFERARWLTAGEMRHWLGNGRAAEPAPVLAYLDLAHALP